MNTIKSTLVIGAGLLACASVNAEIVLTFEGLGDNAQIGNYYDGGAGPNYGISFGPDALALIEVADGGSGNFANPPSGDTVAYFLSGAGDVMNKPSGFNTGFSFYYADQVGFTGSVTVWSGLNGTGTELASLTLPSTPDPYTVFVPVGVAFAGTAESAIFGGSADYIAFDNITLGSSTAGSGAAPDHTSTGAELLAGLAILGAGMAMRKNAALN